MQKPVQSGEYIMNKMLRGIAAHLSKIWSNRPKKAECVLRRDVYTDYHIQKKECNMQPLNVFFAAYGYFNL